MQIKIAEIVSFHATLTSHYYEQGRHTMLWRRPDEKGNFDPYKILVSEMMLQQTQVDRVTPKYQEFFRAFPATRHLSQAPLSEVLRVWSGLGYNRRAQYIWQTAQMVEQEFGGTFPDTSDGLRRLPGIGPNTAGALLAYAYNQPVVFVETNIRTVVIHHFYKSETAVPDTAIRQTLEYIVPKEPDSDSDASRVQGMVLTPREFYWAMMDYGSYLKKSVGNASRASKHYKKQSIFQGSRRQLRGQVIRLLSNGPLSEKQLRGRIDDERLEDVLVALAREGMIVRSGGKVRLS